MSAIRNGSKRSRRPPTANPRYRAVPEAQVVEMLLLEAWCFEVRDGHRREAESETRAAIDRWVAAGLGYAAGADGARCYDPAEVFNLLRWLGVTGQDPFWQDRFVPTHRRHLDETSPGSARGARADCPAMRFRARIRREFDLSRFPAGSPLRLRAPLPIDGHGVRDLKVNPVPPENVEAAVVARGERLEARLAARDAQVTIGADLEFVATARPPAVDRLEPDERQLYLRRSEWPIAVTPMVEALAARLAEARRGPLETVRAFWAYVTGELMHGVIRYDEVPRANPTDWVLETGWHDCQLGAALLVSLCRARGLPARLVSGHFLYPLMPTPHYWAEVWIDERGWTPFDVLCWDLSLAGQDPAWRDRLAGAVDYRVVSECFPLAYTGPMSVRFPDRWQMVTRGDANGIEVAYLDLDAGSTLFRQRVEVEQLGPVAPVPRSGETLAAAAQA